MALTSGTKLGPYEILAPLGAGGMGEVYQARDTRLDRTVAIKILPAHLSDDVLRRQRFERYDIGRQDGIDFIVMEYVEGVTLATRLEKGPLPTAEVLEYGIQLSSALDRAHRNGVTHRDLKPGNIMLTKSGAKLLDFGLAKASSLAASTATISHAAQARPITLEGAVIGTVPYMSPEQVEGKDVDGRSDIFSLGAVLYEMVTGGRAFQGKSDFSVASAVLVKEPQPISTLQPLTPPALERTIRVCLAKDPDARWQSAGDLCTSLENSPSPNAAHDDDRDLSWLNTSHVRALSQDGSTLLFAETGLGTNYAVCLRKTDGSPVAPRRRLARRPFRRR